MNALNGLLLVVFVIAIFTASFLAGEYAGRNDERRKIFADAASKGVGEYVIEYDEKDFSDVHRSFRWKIKP